ncbi:MAG: S46 family peptidase [Bacteroidetes bacterium]|nr:S46 family peptidase [Bacteroidota bacterium]MBU1578075.1 S46 family peptidase [Bacteroidota bacterium]
MKRIGFMLAVLMLPFQAIFAGEGMWIPMLLKQLNEKEMQAMGMRISAEDIYSVNQSSLKDAIVLFGRGCTGEIVSDQGLLLTNHHCGYRQIQQHSSVENDYLTEGFWAMSKEEELPNPGLTVTMMKKMEEVTAQVLEGVSDEMSMEERKQKIDENSKALIEKAKEESGFQVVIKDFFIDNQYYMIYNEVYKDIRLVGAPPSNIGKFGGDTDNWMWPRHTGDFSVFRIYVDKEGKPAEYSAENVPFKPDYHLPVSLNGVEEGDFTFVFGYPARTSEYLPSYAVNLITEVTNPPKIKLRETRLDIFSKYANTDPKVRIQYAAKHAGVANYWKKMIGESKGIRRLNGIERKQDFEQDFTAWTKKENNRYQGIIPAFEDTYSELEKYSLAADYMREGGFGIELLSFAARFNKLSEVTKETTDEQLESMVKSAQSASESFFKDYHLPIDKEVAEALLEIYREEQADDFRPGFLNLIDRKYKGDVSSYVDQLFEKSIFTSQEEVDKLLQNFSHKQVKKILRDPAFEAYSSLRNFYDDKLGTPMKQLAARNDSLQRLYMLAQMQMQSDKRFYPDANFSLRVTYGNVDGYHPADAVYYNYFTTLDGIMEKEDPNIYDYVVEEKLKELYQQQDFGRYGDAKGHMPVGFVASNHTTGGNSGSPVLNADGQMIGINFDRCWEGTMSDLMYDPAMSRNIAVDIRYVLFIMDKFAGAGHLVDEMTVIQ